MKLHMIAVALLALPVFADHHHVGIDTIETESGRKCIPVAGYLPEDAAFSFDDNGYLNESSSVFVFRLNEAIQAGDETGWKANDGIIFASDYYADTGRLDGGDFRVEFKLVTPVNGDPDAVIAWGLTAFDGSLISPARSDATNRDGRSYDVGFASHVHGQVAAMSLSFVYDVEMVIWDANGIYADSDPFYIRFDAGACRADFNQDGFLDFFDFNDFVTDFEAGC